MKNNNLSNYAKSRQESVRVFESDFWEALTHVHPVTPLLLWVPIIFFLLKSSMESGRMSPLEYFVTFFMALITWAFSEYGLHRIVFHYDAKSKIGKRIIFLFHGIHHDEPKDATRLVMPPAPGLIIMSFIYALFYLVVPEVYLYSFTAFFLVGYLCYDYIHYATHHFKMTSRLGRYLKTYHLKHHHSHHPEKYGVSNPFIDYLFGTESFKKN